MRISDWSSDVCSSDLLEPRNPFRHHRRRNAACARRRAQAPCGNDMDEQGGVGIDDCFLIRTTARSEEHTSELQSLMRISYAVFCLKKKTCKTKKNHMTEKNKHNHIMNDV